MNHPKEITFASAPVDKCCAIRMPESTTVVVEEPATKTQRMATIRIKADPIVLTLCTSAALDMERRISIPTLRERERETK